MRCASDEMLQRRQLCRLHSFRVATFHECPGSIWSGHGCTTKNLYCLKCFFLAFLQQNFCDYMVLAMYCNMLWIKNGGSGQINWTCSSSCFSYNRSLKTMDRQPVRASKPPPWLFTSCISSSKNSRLTVACSEECENCFAQTTSLEKLTRTSCLHRARKRLWRSLLWESLPSTSVVISKIWLKSSQMDMKSCKTIVNLCW